MSSNIFPEVLWNGILGDEEARGPEISNIITINKFFVNVVFCLILGKEMILNKLIH